MSPNGAFQKEGAITYLLLLNVRLQRNYVAAVTKQIPLFSDLVPAIFERILNAAGDFSALEVICCTEHSFVAGKARRIKVFAFNDCVLVFAE